jgi:sulfate adenylyltransferase subunit 2
MAYLDELENRSIFMIREAYAQFRDIAMLWSIGKDSTTLLWLLRKAFYDRIPFPVVHIDTSYKFREIYEFRDRIAREWRLDLKIARNDEALAGGMGSGKGKLECCNALKTLALKSAIDRHRYRAILLGIRRDEHGIRAKERYFSPRDRHFEWDYRNQPPELWDQYQSRRNEEDHIRVHPLLDWTELDVWEYVRRENIPIVSLYLARDGQRYRSIGCECCCAAVPSSADTIPSIVAELKTTTTAERAGRAQDKESAYIMQKLRSLGYM